MVLLRIGCVAILFVVAQFVLGNIDNGTSGTANNLIDVAKKSATNKETRRKYHRRSTSSSSGEKSDRRGSDESGQSLGISDGTSSTDSDDLNKKANQPKSSPETKGWRKWHRRCTPCREDMIKKWRDPSISWICGAYQRARRSFKSLCMMHYRNCQDGTMFTKIHDHRCNNDTKRYGDHFFYDYKAKMSDDTSNSKDDDSSSEAEGISH